MLSIDKDKFFTERQLPVVIYYYIYNGKSYEILLEEVIRRIGKSEEKCLFLLNELNASNDFLINVYLQDFADGCMQEYVRKNLIDEICNSLIDDSKSYKFTLNTTEYIAYQDDEGRYHLDKVDEVGKFEGSLRFNKFLGLLSGTLGRHIFDCKRTEKTKVN